MRCVVAVSAPTARGSTRQATKTGTSGRAQDIVADVYVNGELRLSGVNSFSIGNTSVNSYGGDVSLTCNNVFTGLDGTIALRVYSPSGSRGLYFFQELPF